MKKIKTMLDCLMPESRNTEQPPVAATEQPYIDRRAGGFPTSTMSLQQVRRSSRPRV